MACSIIAPATSHVSVERVRELLDYDRSTGHLYWKSSGTGKRTDRPAGTKAPEGYVKVRIDGRLYRAHRIAWMLASGVEPSFEIDHINGDKADNRPENLRDVDHASNVRNRKPTSRTNSTGLTGVFQKGKRFIAVIGVGGRGKYLGTFDTKTEAHDAYMAQRSELHKPAS